MKVDFFEVYSLLFNCGVSVYFIFIPKLIPFDPTDIYYFMIKVQGVHKSLTKYDF